MKLLTFTLAIFSVTLADVSHILNQEEYADAETTTTPQPPPRPYYFAYAAGRFPGHLDRQHIEGSDGSGVVKGTYSYVDPRFRLRVVDYVADKNGFHPILNYTPKPLPDDSPIVAAAKEKHYLQYAKIANQHALGIENAPVPRDSASVARAKANHADLFQKIAEEHARIGAEQAALRAVSNAVENEEQVIV